MRDSARPAAPIHTPRYLLRRKTILNAMAPMQRGTFLEVGCGRGELLPWLHELGFTGVGLEISDDVLPLVYEAAAPLAGIRIAESLDGIAGEEFDYLLSFEVLEHIEDDAGLLEEWLAHLAPNGRFVCTVPAHMKLWSASDDAVGHVRRYEREDVLALLDRVGLESESIRVYGYPLILVTGPLRNLFYRIRSRRWRERSETDRTLSSAIDSTLPAPRRAGFLLRALVNVGARVFYYLGLPLRNTDHGSGYLVIARRKA